ncbi:MAG: response regulator [Pseudomonadota bacterium]
MIVSSAPPPLVRVFIVEDDHAVRDALTLLIESLGWPCSAFSNGERFLQIARPCCDDVLILDLDLPGIKGTDIAASLREKGTIPSIYIISGLRHAAFEAGVAQIDPIAAFRKPLDTSDLLNTVVANHPPTL